MRSEKNWFPPGISPTDRDALLADHARIVEELESMEKARRSIVQTCAKSIGIPRERDVDRIIWHAIVRWANADINSENGAAAVFSAFQAFNTLCVMRLDDSLPVPALMDLPFRDLQSLADESELATFEGFFDTCCHRLSTLHKDFREMLRWLAEPDRCSSKERSRALNFLLEHGGNDAIEFHMYANDSFDGPESRATPFFYWQTARAYRTILSPVAKFLLDRIERYQADENELRVTRSQAIPLLICKRSSCRRFAILVRSTKDFCSASCRSLHRQEIKPNEHAEYQRKYRETYKKP